MDTGRTQTNGPEEKKVDDRAQGIQKITYTDNMCQEKKKGRELTSMEDCVDSSIWEFGDDIKKSKERLITVAINSSDNIRTTEQ